MPINGTIRNEQGVPNSCARRSNHPLGEPLLSAQPHGSASTTRRRHPPDGAGVDDRGHAVRERASGLRCRHSAATFGVVAFAVPRLRDNTRSPRSVLSVHPKERVRVAVPVLALRTRNSVAVSIQAIHVGTDHADLSRVRRTVAGSTGAVDVGIDRDASFGATPRTPTDGYKVKPTSA